MGTVRRRRSSAGQQSDRGYFTSPKTDLEFISSGCHLLDLALGGGWAERRIMNIVGDKSSGKTLLCIEAAANFIRKYPKGKIYYREGEAAFDLEYAMALGMPHEAVDNGKPLETVEDMFEDMSAIIESKRSTPSLYIIDSLDSLSDRSEMGRAMDEGTYGTKKSKNMSELFRRLVRRLSESNVTVIIVSQIRSKIGVTFGRKTTRSGGRALDFYASQVLYISHLSTLNKTVMGMKRAFGVSVLAYVDKNKIGLPFRSANFTIRFGYGIDDYLASLTWLKNLKGANALAKLGITDIATAAKKFSDMNQEAAAKELVRVNEAVSRYWWSVEKTIIPSRGKYSTIEETGK